MNIDLLHIALIVLVIAGVWVLVELALVLQRTRGVVGNLDKSVEQLNTTLAEAQPIVAKLDGAMDELQPAMAQLEPILKNVNTTVGSLNSNLVEIEGVVRDVSAVTGTAGNAANAVNNITDSASQKVSKIFGRRKAAEPERTLEPAAEEGGQAAAAEAWAEATAKPAEAHGKKSYYTYGDAGTTSAMPAANSAAAPAHMAPAASTEPVADPSEVASDLDDPEDDLFATALAPDTTGDLSAAKESLADVTAIIS